MNYSIKTTSDFDNKLKTLAKRYRSIKQDFIDFVCSLRDNPSQGASLGHGFDVNFFGRM